MNPLAALALAGLLLLGGPGNAAEQALPPRDLTVELRQIEEGREEAGHYSVGGDAPAAWERQMVQVRNGEKAVLRLSDSVPLQWTASVTAPTPTPGNNRAATTVPSSGNAATSGASVTQALVWMDAGQSLAVLPRWPGGNKPAVLEIEVQRAAIEPRAGAVLPQQTRNTVSTTVTLPLAEWVTIAASGKAPRPGGYSSESGLQVRRLLQIRVMAP